jgi:hypothetical protein
MRVAFIALAAPGYGVVAAGATDGAGGSRACRVGATAAWTAAPRREGAFVAVRADADARWGIETTMP